MVKLTNWYTLVMYHFYQYQKATGMSRKEVDRAYRRFKRDAGGKKIKIDSFTTLVASMKTNKGECSF